ncbi:hypothetical protein QFC22_000517 [Naganishia vaughanmartiniae]|uniref:Uncharacterized protein n=1 Tax=Naganishia vaughanmartiniae TaxID=1424756 RepID=A0ACC2XPL2_9TREE|nr:hypothetical protein QFC22_000517 [Naganishia vaughanmartiniae]
MSILSPSHAARYFSSLALHSRKVALLGNKDLPPYFSHDQPERYSRRDSKGKKPVREGEEEEVDDREWELRVDLNSSPQSPPLSYLLGSGLLHLRATLPYIFNPPEDAPLFPPSVYSNHVCLRLPAPLPVKLSSLHLYQFIFAMARHGMHVMHTDVYASLDKMTVSPNVTARMATKDLVKRSPNTERKRRNRQVRVELSVNGTPRLTPDHPTSWKTSSLYTFSPLSGLIIEHEVETIRPLPGEGVAEWLSHRLWGFRANTSEELNPVPAHARISDASPLKDALARLSTLGQQKRSIHTMLHRPTCSQLERSPVPSGLGIRKNSSLAPPLERLLQNPELDRESAADELRWMHEAVTAKDLSPKAREDLLQEMVQLRARGKPLQYILGDTEFGPMQLLCRPPTLIPRPETAFVFERFATLLATHSDANTEYKLLDLYTGSAPIPLLMRHLLSDNWRTFGVDLSEAAVKLAKDNVDSITNQHQDRKAPTEIWQADTMKDDFPVETVRRMNGKCHILTANPPYIPYEQYIDLPPGVRAFEDINALLGDGSPSAMLEERKGNGLTHYRRIANLLPALLIPPDEMTDKDLRRVPRVALEIGFDQSEAVQEILKAESGVVTRTECWKDQYGQDRLVVGWL